MYDFGENFKIDISKSKTDSAYTFEGDKFRISILSDVLIRFEYSEKGEFNDYPTFFAQNRSFATPKVIFKEDSNVIILRNEIFEIQYSKGKPFVGSKFAPEQYLKVSLLGTDKMWYFNKTQR